MRQAGILVAGGGSGGLTAVLALTQHGFRLSLREFGAGITISPNGSCVVTALGLLGDMEEVTPDVYDHAVVQHRPDLAAAGGRRLRLAGGPFCRSSAFLRA